MVVELIKGLVQVRDALTLIAFLSLVLLVAFRTQQVPELFFNLLRDKLTRQQFSSLLHRFMMLGFAAFIALVLLAVLAQVLGRLTQPNALTIDDLRNELAKSQATQEEKIHAEAQYKLAMDLLNQRDFQGAIVSLQESIKAIPSLTAQEMLTYLYREKRDFTSEAAAWEAAVKTARQRGDSIALVRLDTVSASGPTLNAEGEHDLIGSSTPLPKGGDKYEAAMPLLPGFYTCAERDGCSAWYGVNLRAGQKLTVKLRSPPPPSGGLGGIEIFGTNGQPVTHAGNVSGTMRGNAGPASSIDQTEWVALESGKYFLLTNADPNTVYLIQVR